VIDAAAVCSALGSVVRVTRVVPSLSALCLGPSLLWQKSAAWRHSASGAVGEYVSMCARVIAMQWAPVEDTRAHVVVVNVDRVGLLAKLSVFVQRTYSS
jgi:hypothetical protein